MKPIIDQKERTLSTDINISSILQAPAGSGKTTLLTQRFLKLLLVVNHPSEIVAITFTKKSAGEMKRRILDLLQSKEASPWVASILERDRLFKWNLLNNPSILNIKTIDSFFISLLDKNSIENNYLFQTQVRPLGLYQEAIYLFLSKYSESNLKESIQYLVRKSKFQFNKIYTLFLNLIENREKVILYFPHVSELDEQFKGNLSSILENKIQSNYCVYVKRLKSLLLDSTLEEFVGLIQYSKENIVLPSSEVVEDAEITFWRHASSIVLNKALVKRKALNKNQGFPTQDKEKKKAMLSFIDSIEEDSELHGLFEVLQSHPIKMSDEESELIVHIFSIFPTLMASLQEIFREKNASDFSEKSIVLYQKLQGEDSENLLMHLDHQIHHLLIDEFQDTSNIQIEIISKLLEMFDASEGKSVFVVGDPMQSIYKFRSADVGIFQDTQSKRSIGPFPLEDLKISANFRSNESLVNSLNNLFSFVFSEKGFYSFNRIDFFSAHPVREDDPYLFSDRIDLKVLEILDKRFSYELENKLVVEKILLLQEKYPEDIIAILIQKRTHLNELIDLMKFHRIKFDAEKLYDSKRNPVVLNMIDMISIIYFTEHEIHHDALLRSPLVGVSLNDLHRIHSLEMMDKFLLFADLSEEIDRLKSHGLSLSSIRKILRVNKVLRVCLQNKYKISPRELIFNLFFQLGGEYAYPDYHVDFIHHIVHEISEILDEYSPFNVKMDLIKEAIGKLFLSEKSLDAKVVIMTIHQSKGLEFDHVMIPYLNESKQFRSNQPILINITENSFFLMGSVFNQKDKSGTLYKYLKNIEDRKEKSEVRRLFYVACTRAKKSLHLIASMFEGKMNSNSFLSTIPQNMLEGALLKEEFSPAAEAFTVKDVFSLSDQFEVSFQLNERKMQEAPDFSESLERVYGIMLHFVLSKLSQYSLDFNQIDFFLSYDFIENFLILNNFYSEYRDSVPWLEKKIKEDFKDMLKDPVFHWIFKKRDFAFSEKRFFYRDADNKVASIQPDLFFQEDKSIWIVDFKTMGSFQDKIQKKNLFFEEKLNVFKAQLTQYQNILALKFKMPVKRGVYFTSLQKWVSFDE